MKKLLLVVLSCFTVSAFAFHCHQSFPHWSCNNASTYKKLRKIHHFIQANKDKGDVALFDWDGTLYDERIPVKGPYDTGWKLSGEAVWHIFGGEHHDFPAFKSTQRAQTLSVVRQVNYLQGKTSAKIMPYSAFSQEATIEQGLTPKQMNQDLQAYFAAYPATRYAYKPMLDLVQQFKNHGYSTWIITGSNPYYIIDLLSHIDQTLSYHLLPKNCHPNHPNMLACRVVGNGAMRNAAGQFTRVYDNRFVRRPLSKNINLLQRTIVDGPGKRVAIKNYILQHHKRPYVFYAGNSGGDYASVTYLFAQRHQPVLSVSVNPRGTLLDLVHAYAPKHMLVFKMSPN